MSEHKVEITPYLQKNGMFSIQKDLFSEENKKQETLTPIQQNVIFQGINNSFAMTIISQQNQQDADNSYENTICRIYCLCCICIAAGAIAITIACQY
jgi:hypothetical protein